MSVYFECTDKEETKRLYFVEILEIKQNITFIQPKAAVLRNFGETCVKPLWKTDIVRPTCLLQFNFIRHARKRPNRLKEKSLESPSHPLFKVSHFMWCEDADVWLWMFKNKWKKKTAIPRFPITKLSWDDCNPETWNSLKSHSHRLLFFTALCLCPPPHFQNNDEDRKQISHPFAPPTLKCGTRKSLEEKR